MSATARLPSAPVRAGRRCDVRRGHRDGCWEATLPASYAATVSTRMLIILALLCGVAILVAFAVQAAQII